MPVLPFRQNDNTLAAETGSHWPAEAPVPRLGEILRRQGRIDRGQIDRAIMRQRREELKLGEVLCSQELLDPADVLNALAQQFDVDIVDLASDGPDPALNGVIPAEICLKLGICPWRKRGHVTIFAISDPAGFAAIRPQVNAWVGHSEFVLSSHRQIETHIHQASVGYLSDRANVLCPASFSCRSWAAPLGYRVSLYAFAVLVAAVLTFPGTAVGVLMAWILVNLAAASFLRLAALRVQIRARHRNGTAPQTALPPARLPIVSVLIPLFREATILPGLITRLGSSEYPKSLLDVCLVLEAGDTQTIDAARKMELPAWMRVVEVPASALQTKPRAMNYALNFCKGSIVGIYDAEDAPDPDQIHRIVTAFHHSGPDVACVQGYLDFYNARRNWLSRCFTIEYATWFRVVMHGIEKLRLPVPLGGTTVFFRRAALESLGAWDAHNVTEDADLGFRLARFGYRCLFLPTVTLEEANCRLWPWVRQRSRWLKGYAMTWITHMRNPRQLWRDLGPKRFLAFQILLLGTYTNFLFAPVIWSLWLISFGLTPGYASLLPSAAWWMMGSAFVGAEMVLLVTGLFAVSGPRHRHLIPYVITMPLYWPLATLAVFKATAELLVAPFYWDKTRHGHLSTPKDVD